MSQEQKIVEVNDIELEEGMSLWRYAALRTWNKKIGDHDPDEVLSETAQQLVEKYPEEMGVDDMSDKYDPVDTIHTDLRANPGIYDDTGLLNYHAMEVERVSCFRGITEISIKDWKEEKTYSFNSERDEAEVSTYTTFEPLDVLEDHLGVTILLAGEDDEE